MSDSSAPVAPAGGALVLSPMPLGGKRRSKKRSLKMSARVKKALRSLTKLKLGGEQTAVIPGGADAPPTLVTSATGGPAPVAPTKAGRRGRSRKTRRSRKH